MRTFSAPVSRLSMMLAFAPHARGDAAPAKADHAGGAPAKTAPVDTSPIAATVGAESATALTAHLNGAGFDLAADVTARDPEGKAIIRTRALQARFVALSAAVAGLAALEKALDETNVELAGRYSRAVNPEIKTFSLDARGTKLDAGAPAASVWFDGRVRQVNGSTEMRLYPKVAPKPKAANGKPGAPAPQDIDDLS